MVVTIGAGFVLLAVLGTLFSAAYASQRVTSRATALHAADESLRAATVVRAQLALAVHMAAVDREFGSNSADALDVSVTETTEALDELAARLHDLQTAGFSSDELNESAGEFIASSVAVLDLLEHGDSEDAQDAAEVRLPESFERLIDETVSTRDTLRADVAASDRLMSRFADLARFLVAFLVPAAVIVIYRELSTRLQRQAELEARLEAEREISQAREEFIANASHELRTPLTGIHGLAILLEEDQAVQQSDMARELLGMIVSESADLARMVEDLLTAARLDAGAIHYAFEDSDVVAEVNEVVEPMQRNGVAISVACEPGSIRVDRLRFRQIVRNLVSNARKYGGPDIRVEGRAVGHTYECAVVDDGDGIPDELSERLFERFIHQGHKTAVKESVGLGLSIVYALAHDMGGTVRYERHSETRFVVVLPIIDPDAEPRLAAEQTPEAIPT